MDEISRCTSQSIGPANQLFSLLMQTLIQAQGSISPPGMWPKDYLPTAIENGKNGKNVKLAKKMSINKVIR